MTAIFVIVGSILLLIIDRMTIKKRRQAARRKKMASLPLRVDLGIKRGEGYASHLFQLQNKLEESLDPTFMANVKKRVMEKQKWSEKEYEIYLYGLKQYFLMAYLIKNVSMFSEEVDAIWHEMILFTEEYRDFTGKFYGEMLEHIPNMAKGTNPNARPEFEWLYSQFFKVDDLASIIYTNFFRRGFNKDYIDQVERLGKANLKERFFRNDPLSQEVASLVALNMRTQVEKGKELRSQGGKRRSRPDYSSDSGGESVGLFLFDSHHSHHHNSDSSNDSSDSGGHSCGGSCGGGCGSS